MVAQRLRLPLPDLLSGSLRIHLPGASQVDIARLAALAPGDHWRPSAGLGHLEPAREDGDLLCGEGCTQVTWSEMAFVLC